ncbi:G patch domain-containing protein 3-like [Haliotis cracherodii]|uniref:G patch domain-containing protein 3-like n=1 Tax=Haliotis cracherodii TaxID=6455 RepID=UPI0039E82AC8
MAAKEKHKQSDSMVYAIINNIPPDYHSKDIRNYFSQFIETRGFDCFHFRHRPETQAKKVPEKETGDEVKSPISRAGTSDPVRRGTTCCVVRLKADNLVTLLKMYHRKHWLDRNGDSISSYCHITKIKLTEDVSVDQQREQVYKTRSEIKLTPSDSRDFTSSDLLNLPELHPPDIMPHGNVGTPTKDFLDFIKECRLPPSVIKKLGLSFPKTRTNRKYGSVPYEYAGPRSYRNHGNEYDEEEADWTVYTGEGHELVSVDGSIVGNMEESTLVQDGEQRKDEEKELTRKEKKARKKQERKKTKKLMDEKIEEKMMMQHEDSNEDNDSCEEWERHEAVTDDPDNQERLKERLFEEEIELKWEKGGSGLVFYTDAQYWQEKEGDFDEQTADDLNVDMSGYYEDGAGDGDARDYITLRQEQRRREGLEETDRFSVGIGKFEKHTKGIGRKVLERQGWQEGQGLGNTITGISDALDNDGQHPRDKKGFGYHGEKLIRFGAQNIKRQFIRTETLITTKYDEPDVVDPPEKLLRRKDHYGLKHRSHNEDSSSR